MKMLKVNHKKGIKRSSFFLRTGLGRRGTTHSMSQMEKQVKKILSESDQNLIVMMKG